MKCTECLVLLPEYAYGALNDDMKREVEAHLRGCPECAAELQATERFRDLTEPGAAETSPPEGYFDSVWTGIYERAQREGAAPGESTDGWAVRLLRYLPPLRPYQYASVAALAVLAVMLYNTVERDNRLPNRFSIAGRLSSTITEKINKSLESTTDRPALAVNTPESGTAGVPGPQNFDWEKVLDSESRVNAYESLTDVLADFIISIQE